MRHSERRKLLEGGNVYEVLKWRQLLKLICWDLFRFYPPYKKRIDTFYNSLKIGKSTLFAYSDAVCCDETDEERKDRLFWKMEIEKIQYNVNSKNREYPQSYIEKLSTVQHIDNIAKCVIINSASRKMDNEQ